MRLNELSSIKKAWFFSTLIIFSKNHPLCDPTDDIDLSGMPQLIKVG